MALVLSIGERRRCAVAHHQLIGPVQQKRLASQMLFLLGDEQHEPGITEHPAVGSRPVGPFLEMLEWLVAFEPGIEHRVSVSEIGDATAA